MLLGARAEGSGQSENGQRRNSGIHGLEPDLPGARSSENPSNLSPQRKTRGILGARREASGAGRLGWGGPDSQLSRCV